MTKAEILKKHNMTEQEFYAKYPTQESYMKEFANGGQMNFYNNEINRDNTLMKAGVNIFGNMIAPGAGSVASGLFANGGNLTYMPNASTHEESPYGGIPIGQDNLVEGNETIMDGDYVFSDRLKLGKKTFAAISKDIDRRYSKRSDDKISKEAKERELKQLQQKQEIERLNKQIKDVYTHAYGGTLGKLMLDGTGPLPNSLKRPLTPSDTFYQPDAFPINNNTTDPRINIPVNGPLETPYFKFNPNDINLDTNDDNIKNEESYRSPEFTSLLENEAFGKNKNFSNRKYPYSSTDSAQIPLPDKVKSNYKGLGLAAGMQALSPLFSIGKGLLDRGSIAYQGYKPEYFHDPYVDTQIRSNANTQSNIARSEIMNNSSLSQGQKYAMLNSLATGAAQTSGSQIAENRFKMNSYNNELLNKKRMYDSEIYNENIDANEQKRDMADMAISTGLDSLGNRTAGTIKDRNAYDSNEAYNNSMFDILRNSHNNYEYLKDADGNISLKQKVSAYGGKMKRYC